MKLIRLDDMFLPGVTTCDGDTVVVIIVYTVLMTAKKEAVC